MRQKYIDEAIGIWFLFGQHPDGCVDVSDGNRDVFTHIPKDRAERLCTMHDEFREQVYAEFGVA